MKLYNAFPSPSFHSMLAAILAVVNTAFQHTRFLANELPDKFKTLNKSKKQTMIALLCLVSFFVVGAISGVASLKHNTDSSDRSEHYNAFNSTDMVLSIIARQQGIMANNTTPGSALQAGIVQKAFTAYNTYYGRHAQIQEYIDHSTMSAARYMASTIDDVKDWPLDRFSNANAMLSGSDPAYDNALDALRTSLRLNQRNNENGLWYWESYPEWSYLDGMYSLGPFAVLDSRLTGQGVNATVTWTRIGTRNSAAMEDMHLQFRLLWDHCYNSTTGLLVHGYDASRKASWASRTNGASAVVWGRSLGWFMMALVDTLEVLYGAAGPAVPGSEPLLGMYQRLAVSVMGYADKNSRGWYQVVDMAGRDGNYIESSATAMFSYALLKGSRLRYLEPSDITAAREAGRAAHLLLARDFVTTEPDGTLGFNGTVSVCSLNSSATYDVSFPI